MPQPKTIRRLGYVGVPVVLIVAVILLWQWDWFIPLVDARASAALGRPVTMAHLHVGLGKIVTVTADDVTIDNPAGFTADAPLARLAHLTVQLDAMAYIRTRAVVIPTIDVDHPDVAVIGQADGKNNATFDFGGGDTKQPAQPDPNPTKIENLSIENGRAHVVLPAQKADFMLDIATRPGTDATPAGQLVVEAKGKYADQPVTGKLVSGAVLTVTDATHPFPIDLSLVNGATKVSLVGTLQDPLHFAGARLKLSLAGATMSDLFPLTGIPIPKTPSYHVAGQLDYADGKIRMSDIDGAVGNSDLEGSIAAGPGKEREDVVADLQSRQVDLADLGGFIGSEPGSAKGANETPQQRTAIVRAEASPKLLPSQKINLPKLRQADVHLKYRGAKIEGRSVPFDSLIVDLDLVDGRLTLHPIVLTVGTGRISGDIDLNPEAHDEITAKTDVKFEKVDVSRLMASTHAFTGAGSIGGTLAFTTTGDSVASFLGHGNGSLDVYMSGGDLSALLVDLAGLEFGNAVLSALGVPSQAKVQCMIGRFGLEHGVLDTRTMVLDTTEAVMTGEGDVDFANETLRYKLTTKPRHFTIGSLPAPIGIGGTFKNPKVGPDLVALGIRGGAAVGLGILAGPLAVLPTIQFGVGNEDRCAGLLAQAQK